MSAVPDWIVEKAARVLPPDALRAVRVALEAVADDLRADAWEHGHAAGTSYGITLAHAAVAHTERPARSPNPYTKENQR